MRDGQQNGIGDEVVVEHRALIEDQGPGPLHHPVRGDVLVVGEDHCIQFEPFRQSGCVRIGRGPLDHHELYVAQDEPLSAAGLWGCNLYASGSCGGPPRANVSLQRGWAAEFKQRGPPL